MQLLTPGLGLLVWTLVAVTGFHERDKKAILDVDLLGFYALADAGFGFFENQGHGHFVGFSSIDAFG